MAVAVGPHGRQVPYRVAVALLQEGRPPRGPMAPMPGMAVRPVEEALEARLEMEG